LLCEEELQPLNEILSVIFSQISANVVEMKRLADLRDTLLPRLMSGELDVSNIGI
jgi:type I restriction enzyme S subunit